MSESPVPDTGRFPDDLATILGSEQTVTELLRRILDMAVTTVSPISAASVTLVAKSPPGYATALATDDSARSVDEAQYRDGLGPCLEAVRTSAEVTVTLPREGWKTFSEAAGAAGFRSVWSIPLCVDGRPEGSLNLYSGSDLPWEHGATGTARLIGCQAEVVLVNAVALARSEHLNATLRKALETRTVIGQAQGVLMARQHIDAQEAFDILRRASQRTNRKLRDIAAEIVASVATDQPAEG